MQPQESDFDCLAEFYRSALPAAVRRLRTWHGLDPAHHGDVVDDLRQDIAVDFVTHRDELNQLPPQARHDRWLRIVGRSHYSLRTKGRQVTAATDLDALADAAPPPTPASLDDLDTAFVDDLLRNAVRLKNGRLNEKITARSIGITPVRLRAQQARLVDALAGARAIEFWQRRLVEALLGLAADLLRDSGRVLIHAERTRPRPDPHARLERIARLRAQLKLLPVGDDLRRVLVRYGRRARYVFDPGVALASALSLAPRDPQVQLWVFEHRAMLGDLGGALGAVRRARELDGDPVSCVLARARILELRGRPAHAARLLARARRRREDPRLRLCLERVQQCG